jgi:hypothetical protein
MKFLITISSQIFTPSRGWRRAFLAFIPTSDRQSVSCWKFHLMIFPSFPRSQLKLSLLLSRAENKKCLFFSTHNWAIFLHLIHRGKISIILLSFYLREEFLCKFHVLGRVSLFSECRHHFVITSCRQCGNWIVLKITFGIFWLEGFPDI